MNHSQAAGTRSAPRVVVAGPGSNVTIPGMMTAEVVGALAMRARVTKVAVDLSKDYDSGLHRAKSLSSIYRSDGVTEIFHHARLASQRRLQFRGYFKDAIDLAIALVWPGLDNSWVGEFVDVARGCGARTAVLVVTHPSVNNGAVSITSEVAEADLVLVGDIMDATLLSASLGRTRPIVEVHRALSLIGRSTEDDRKRLTTFLPKDDENSLLSVLTAFDALPSEWVTNYDLRIIMRYSSRSILDRVAASYFVDRVQLIGDDFSSVDMQKIVSDSSAVSVADPTVDSRAFSTAMEMGVSAVVLSENMVTEVGRGYVGGLLADIHRPTSVYVAHNHALRLSELRFPSPDAWFDLAARLDSILMDIRDGLREGASL